MTQSGHWHEQKLRLFSPRADIQMSGSPRATQWVTQGLPYPDFRDTPMVHNGSMDENPARADQACVSAETQLRGCGDHAPLQPAGSVLRQTLTALKKIEANKNSMGEIINGWVVTKRLGTSGLHVK
jgi:hypothetical protein